MQVRLKKQGATMLKVLLAIALLMTLAACSDSSPSDTPQATSTMPSATASGTATFTQTPGTSASPTVSGTPVATAVSGALTLSILGPVDEIVVDTSTVTVRGQATAGAEVSVNGNVVNVDTNGSFTTIVTLEEGPNEIEIMATDEAENEASITITVFYLR